VEKPGFEPLLFTNGSTCTATTRFNLDAEAVLDNIIVVGALYSCTPVEKSVLSHSAWKRLGLVTQLLDLRRDLGFSV
jgi:hypothetical protein